MPALIQPVREEAIAPLERFGRALGTCFQLADDLLDFTATATTLGKPVLSDLKEGKLTLPLLLLLPRIPAGDRAKIERVLAERAFAAVSAEEILEIVEREGTLEEVAAEARRKAAEAREALAIFPDSPARRALEFAPDFVLHRRA